MYTRLQFALWSAAAVIGVSYGNSDAANTKNPSAKSSTPAPAKSTGDTHHFAHVVSKLHKAKHLLDHASHADNGHRAKADHEIGQAIHLLHHEHHKKGTATPARSTAHKAGEKKAQSQQASDTEFAQAEKLVHAAILELHNHKHDENARHASKLLHEASHDIELAIHLHHKIHQK